MARLIVVTPNPATDVTYRVPVYENGSTVRVSDVSRRPGGKGLNVVRVLRTLGEPAVAVLPLGGASGQWVSSMMDAEGISASIVPIAGETRSTVAVVDPVGHPTLFNEPGPALTQDEGGRLIEATVRECEPGCAVVISGSLPPGLDPQWLEHLVRAVRAVGAKVLVDTSGEALLAAARAGADVLKPNAQEAIQATNDNRLPLVSSSDGPVGIAPELHAAVTHLQQLGATTVVVSQGAGGLVAFAEGRVVSQPAVRGVSGNPTGAGDAATAGFALAWARGDDLRNALKLAAALGAAAVKQPGAGEVDPADVRAFEEELS
ncbi:1-phosphofructokinase family hexose kinase [Kineosporia babensis]|uniref:Hexose kinase n=1 Tax=Kineosporia babensis TaxID=499548 RepID=A0A9X1NJA8_9ACTN|nr:hexose kinase [Kineosporia babensis]MCD5314241.1 hexose kinase [Kineosporia babensis]